MTINPLRQMKKIIYFVMMALAAVSCVKEQAEQQLMQITEIVAQAGDDESKTMIHGSDIRWTEGDAINLFYGDKGGSKFTTNITSPSPVATFYGSLGVDTGAAAADYWAVYPYDANNTCDGNSITASIPGTQQCIAGNVSGNIGDKVNPAVAKSATTSLKFYNVGSWIVFSFTQSDITAVVFRGNNNEDVGGDLRVTMDADDRPVAEVIHGIKEITIIPTGVNFIKGYQYFAVVLPQTFTKGYTLTLYKGNEVAECVVSHSAEFLRSQYRRKQNADEGLVFSPVELPDSFEAVDLGLSVKWSSCNLGATSPEEYGDYYAWGEVEPYYTYLDKSDWSFAWKADKQNGYHVDSYRWCDGSFDSLSKYNYDSSYGTVDNKTLLDLDDDAARVALGNKWRIPTFAEWAELLDNRNCAWTAGTVNGVRGYIVTSKKAGFTGNSIFIPGASSVSNSSHSASENDNKIAFYWTSSLYVWNNSVTWSYSIEPDNAYCFGWDLSTTYPHFGRWYRMSGFTVRPVFGDLVPVTGLELSPASVQIETNSSLQLTATVSPSDATEKTLSWVSSNTNVVNVDKNGLITTGYKSGVATITVRTLDGLYTRTCRVIVGTPLPTAVDLGLTVRWGSFNLGATAPEEYGDYYAWGELNPYYSFLEPLGWKNGKAAGYDWLSYKWCNGSSHSLSRYNYDGSFGSVDDNATLLVQDDAAYSKLSVSWTVPSSAEWAELMNPDNCSWTWITQNGVPGYLVTSKIKGFTDKSIFIPAAGCFSGTDCGMSGSEGYYWSSSLSTGSPIQAYSLYFNSSSYSREGLDRCDGLAIRPVAKAVNKEVTINITTYASDNNWTAGGAFYDTVEDRGVTATASWSGANMNGANYGDWRFYQARGGGLTISVREGHTLQSVRFTYGNKNEGVIVYNGTQYSSNSTILLPGTESSAFFTVSSTDSSISNAQVRLTELYVVYK